MMRFSGALAALAILVSGCGGEGPDNGSAAPADGIAGLRECLDDAGAKIASRPNDLKFVGGEIPSVRIAAKLEDGTAANSLKGDGWTVYTAGESESFTAKIAKPDRPGVVVAYVKPLDPATVEVADACLGS